MKNYLILEHSTCLIKHETIDVKIQEYSQDMLDHINANLTEVFTIKPITLFNGMIVRNEYAVPFCAGRVFIETGIIPVAVGFTHNICLFVPTTNQYPQRNYNPREEAEFV